MFSIVGFIASILDIDPVSKRCGSGSVLVPLVDRLAATMPSFPRLTIVLEKVLIGIISG